MVGGIEQVFEINRNFRNEGMDSSHSPEFAMLEAYQAYGDYNSIGELTQALIQEAAQSVHGSTTVVHQDGTELDFGGAWEQITVFGSLSAALGDEVTVATPLKTLQKYAKKIGLDAPPRGSRRR